MSFSRPVVVSIAGFDPSGGAGILADIKTFEQHQVYGLGVLTANTIQSDEKVMQVEWIPVRKIKEQLQVLLDRWNPEWFKIGIVESSEVLLELIQFIIQHNIYAKFIWDPVLQSSSGYQFFKSEHDLEVLLQHITVLTPNLPEFDCLIGSSEKALELSYKRMIYQKDGHREEALLGQDVLFWNGDKYFFEPLNRTFAKHGSGCILSSAICANFASGIQPHLAFEKAKQYTEKVLSSNPSLLGWHT